MFYEQHIKRPESQESFICESALGICFPLKRTSLLKNQTALVTLENGLIRVICSGDLLRCMFFDSLKRTDWIICSGIILSAWFDTGNQSSILIQCTVWINGSMHAWELLTEHNSATIYLNGGERGHQVWLVWKRVAVRLLRLHFKNAAA